MIGVSRQTILSDRTDKPRFIKDTFPYLIAVALLAAAIIVAFSVLSVSLLYTSEETLKGSPIGDSPLEDKVINTAVSHRNSKSSSVQVQTKSPSSNDAGNMPSATAVLPPSNMPREETVSTIRSAIVVRQRCFWIRATDTDIISAQHVWTGGLERLGPVRSR